MAFGDIWFQCKCGKLYREKRSADDCCPFQNRVFECESIFKGLSIEEKFDGVHYHHSQQSFDDCQRLKIRMREIDEQSKRTNLRH